jgi:hypothetical protein
MSLEFFNENIAEVLFASDGMEIQVLDETSGPAGRLVGRDHSVYSIPATNTKLEGKSQLTFLVSADKQASDRENCEDMHNNVLQKMRDRIFRRAVFLSELHKNKLLRVKVTTDFQKQCRKKLISIQCVNFS